jgi:hypothetical protein
MMTPEELREVENGTGNWVWSNPELKKVNVLQDGTAFWEFTIRHIPEPKGKDILLHVHGKRIQMKGLENGSINIRWADAAELEGLPLPKTLALELFTLGTICTEDNFMALIQQRRPDKLGTAQIAPEVHTYVGRPKKATSQ